MNFLRTHQRNALRALLMGFEGRLASMDLEPSESIEFHYKAESPYSLHWRPSRMAGVPRCFMLVHAAHGSQVLSDAEDDGLLIEGVRHLPELLELMLVQYKQHELVFDTLMATLQEAINRWYEETVPPEPEDPPEAVFVPPISYPAPTPVDPSVYFRPWLTSALAQAGVASPESELLLTGSVKDMMDEYADASESEQEDTRLYFMQALDASLHEDGEG